MVSIRRAIPAAARDLDHRPHGHEARGISRLTYAIGQRIVVDMRGLTTAVAHKEDAVVATSRVRVDDIGIRRLDALRQILGHEQIEDAIDTVGRDTPIFGLRDRIGNIVGRCRPIESRQRSEYGRAHRRPLLTRAFECGLRLSLQLGAVGKLMMMRVRHAQKIGRALTRGKFELHVRGISERRAGRIEALEKLQLTRIQIRHGPIFEPPRGPTH